MRIDDVLAFDEFVVPLNDGGLAAALAALRSLPDMAARQSGERLAPVRCTGLALSRMLELMLHDGSAQRLRPAGIRLVTLCAGPTSHGPGAVLKSAFDPEDTEADEQEEAGGGGGGGGGAGGLVGGLTAAAAKLRGAASKGSAVVSPSSWAGRAALDFYRRLGEAAALGGVSIEVCALASKASTNFGLPLMTSLSTLSGGVVRRYELYRGVAAAAERLGADMANMSERAVAWNCTLRVRATPEYKVSLEPHEPD